LLTEQGEMKQDGWYLICYQWIKKLIIYTN